MRFAVSLFSRTALFILLLAAVLAGTALRADAQQAQDGSALVIATREAPPFSMKADDGTWEGLSIRIWKAIADDLGLDYRYEEAGLQELIDGVADGTFDAGVAALTITPERERRLDFTHAFYSTGFAIAIPTQDAGWFVLLSGLVSWQFLHAILLLACLLAIVGLLFWLVERKANSDEFGGAPLKGIGSGFWFSAVTMTTVGYGDKAPVTLAGRIIALVWMFTAVIIISTFTGMIASSLTADRLAGAIQGPEDLPKARVGSIEGTASDAWLTADHIGFRSFESVEAGLKALQDGGIEAFVYDAPLVRYLAVTEFADDIEVLPATYGRQDYGIALPQGAEMRETANRALLRYIESQDWTEALTRTFGGAN